MPAYLYLPRHSTRALTLQSTVHVRTVHVRIDDEERRVLKQLCVSLDYVLAQADPNHHDAVHLSIIFASKAWHAIMSLLTTTLLATLYDEVQGHDIEYKADAFWQTYLQNVFPQSEAYAVCSQWAPNANDRHRVDIAVRQLRMAPEGGFMATLLFCETKRQGTHPKDAEDQVKSAAARYFEANQHAPSIYGMTGWGTAARCWIVHRPTGREGVKLRAMFGNDERGDKAQYIDAANERASLITDFIAQIKGVAEPTQYTGTYDASSDMAEGSGGWQVSYSSW